MKKIQKMSLANIKGKLSRAEMKRIMAGSGGGGSGCGHLGDGCIWFSCCPGLHCHDWGNGLTACVTTP